MIIIPPPYLCSTPQSKGVLFCKSDKDTHLASKSTNLQRVLLASHLLKAPPPIAPSHTASPTHPYISPMPTMVFLPSFVFDVCPASIRQGDANVGKNDRNTRRLATLLSKGATLCKYLIHHIC